MLDIHTHSVPLVPGTAIVNCYPETFVPEAGGLYSVGIHPWHADEADETRKELLRQSVCHPQVMAVGETGLDRLCKVPMPIQEELFTRQARLAEEVRKPLIIHLVKATDELLRIRKSLRPTMPWIVHGFRGKAEAAEQLLRHGLYLSFGEKFQEQAVRHVPDDRLLLETDEAADIGEVTRRVAAARGTDEETLRQTVQANLRRIFPALMP